MASLLGQFYNKIKGSQEDIASEGLAYILQHSKSAKNALQKIIKLESGLNFQDINYTTQNVGEKLERTDISGYNFDNQEVIILEAKFWASLTDNQPIGYLERLSANSILLFICPTLRVSPIFNEVQKRISDAKLDFDSNPNGYSIKLANDKSVVVKTWNEILGAIRLQLIQDNDQYLSDIDQIIGFCETVDSNAFMPFHSKDFSPSNAKRINSFYDIADKVINELRKHKMADTTRLKATPQRNGYSRYFRIDKLGVALNVRFDFWEKVADTPFWIYFGWDHQRDEHLKKLIKIIASKRSIITYENNNNLYLPLFPVVEQTEDIVVKNITEQIISLYKELIKEKSASELINNFVNEDSQK
jgi:hypothetical protein